MNYNEFKKGGEKMRKQLISLLGGGILTLLVIFLLPRLAHWERVEWGRVQLNQERTITVTGQAKGQQKSQMAKFNVRVERVNDDKQRAIDEVNQTMSRIISQLKDFGIAEKDIKTTGINIYQREEAYYEEGRQKTRPGQWVVSNGIEIILRQVDRSSALSDLLGRSGATNIHGPSFYLDETESLVASLLGEAFKDAREKAEKLAQASGLRLGKVISIKEENSYSPPVGIGGAGPIEPGVGTVSVRVIVVFALEE